MCVCARASLRACACACVWVRDRPQIAPFAALGRKSHLCGAPLRWTPAAGWAATRVRRWAKRGGASTAGTSRGSMGADWRPQIGSGGHCRRCMHAFVLACMRPARMRECVHALFGARLYTCPDWFDTHNGLAIRTISRHVRAYMILARWPGAASWCGCNGSARQRGATE